MMGGKILLESQENSSMFENCLKRTGMIYIIEKGSTCFKEEVFIFCWWRLVFSHFDNLNSLLSCQQILQLSMVLKSACAESVAVRGAESVALRGAESLF